MTYESGGSKTQYAGNGAATAFPTVFSFQLNSHVKVALTTGGAVVPLTEGVDYTLAGAGQESGTLTFPKSGSARHVLAVGERLTIWLAPPIVQGRQFDNGFLDLAEVEAALDMLTMIAQALDERLGRTVQFPVSATEEEVLNSEDFLAATKANMEAAQAAQALAETARSGAQAAKTAADADAVATAVDRVQTWLDRAAVANDKATVAADKAIVAADKATVAADKATTSGCKDTAVAAAATAATKAGDAETARGLAVSAQVAAEAALASTLAAYDNFDDRYLGAKSGDPTLDNDGNALVAGALYFNTIIGGMKVYTGSAWVAAYISGSGYLTTSGNLSDLADIPTARANMGLDTLSRRNRLCNGDFRVDNINIGSSVTPAASGYIVDNGLLNISQASKLTAQRIASNLTGFPYSEKFTVASAFTPGASDYFNFNRCVEGLDIADLMLGTSNAKAFTVSFVAKVSVAGTYAFRLFSPAANRSYVWTQVLSSGENRVTKTVAGDTTGAWANDNTCAMYLAFDLGTGSTYQTATLNAWQAGNYISTTGVVSLVANAGATYEISGIQIEKGSFATPFEVLPYQQAEAWCQRYHPCLRNATAGFVYIGTISGRGTTNGIADFPLPVTPRITCTGLVCSNMSTLYVYDAVGGTAAPSAFTYNGGALNAGNALVTMGSAMLAARGVAELYFSGAGFIRFTGAEL